MLPTPFDPETRVFTPQIIISLTKALEEDGVALSDTLEGTGIGDEALLLPDTRISFTQICTVFRNSMRLAAHPNTALRAGQNMRLTSYGMYGYALLSSPTTKDRVEFATKRCMSR